MKQKLPKAALWIVTLAYWCGWRYGSVWSTDDAGNPYVTVHVRRKLTGGQCWHYELVWHTRDTGTLRYRGGVHRTPDRMEWRASPALAVVQEVISSNPEPGYGLPSHDG